LSQLSGCRASREIFYVGWLKAEVGFQTQFFQLPFKPFKSSIKVFKAYRALLRHHER